MFDKLTIDELSELQEALFSGYNSASRASMLTEGSMFWRGIPQLRLEIEQLYREISGKLAEKLYRQPVGA